MANFSCAALLGGATFTGRLYFQGPGGAYGSSGAVTILDAPGNPQAGIIQFADNAGVRQLGYIFGLTQSAGGLGFFGGPVGIDTAKAQQGEIEELRAALAAVASSAK